MYLYNIFLLVICRKLLKYSDYEADRRERFNGELQKLRAELSTEVHMNSKMEVVMAALLFVQRCKDKHLGYLSEGKPIHKKKC